MTAAHMGVVLIASGDAATCEAIAELVGRVGLATAAVDTGSDALAFAQVEMPALVVLAVDLTDPSGYEVCRDLREQFGDGLPIVFVSASRPEPRDEIAGLLLGADDYFATPLRADRFIARVRRLVATRSAAPLAPSTLTAREREVLGLLVAGRRSADIAERLCITKKTASTHIEHILRKLGAHTQGQAIAIALRDRVVELPVPAVATTA